MTGGVIATVGEVGFKATAGKALKGVGDWIGSLDAIHLTALVFAIAAVWEFIMIHGLEFKVIPGIGPKIHIVSMQGKIDAAKAETAQVRVQLVTSVKNESTLRGTIKNQNQRIDQLGKQSAQEQAAAQKANEKADQKAREAQNARDALRRSAANKVSGHCEPSDTLKRQWQ